MTEPEKSIDITDCPTQKMWNSLNCRCKPKCARCGYGPHMAIHGPLDGQPVGSPPWGHEYLPRSKA